MQHIQMHMFVSYTEHKQDYTHKYAIMYNTVLWLYIHIHVYVYNVCTFVFSVHIISEEGARTKVNQFDLAGLEVDENILILHISVQDSHRHAVLDSLHNLTKQKSSRSFAHYTFP